MKTMILIPCMDMVHTAFMRSLLMLNTAGHDITYGIHSGSLIYDARNKLLDAAKKANVDQILWFDSDMLIPVNTLQLLTEDIKAGCDIVTGLYFKRKKPYEPVIYKECEIQQITPDQLLPLAAPYDDYPKNQLFEVQAFGFGCVLMTMEAANKVVGELGLMPFMPVAGFGEDLSFCMRARHVGLKLWCDSRVSLGHVGQYTFTEVDYNGKLGIGQQGEAGGESKNNSI